MKFRSPNGEEFELDGIAVTNEIDNADVIAEVEIFDQDGGLVRRMRVPAGSTVVFYVRPWWRRLLRRLIRWFRLKAGHHG